MTANFNDVKAAMGEGTVLLDVRNTDDVQKLGKIPGSHNVPFPEFEDSLGLDDSQFEEKYGFAKPQPDDAIITFCLRGSHAAKATDALKAQSYNNVRTYAGSFNDWMAKGGDVDKE